QVAVLAELVETRKRQVAHQEGLKLVAARGKHVTVGMALLDVASVEAVDFLAEIGAGGGDLKVGVAFEDASLLAAGGEAVDRDACRDAGVAVLAVGPEIGRASCRERV